MRMEKKGVTHPTKTAKYCNYSKFNSNKLNKILQLIARK